MSGLPGGDLVRVLSRALDALRQIGNLPFMPVRSNHGNNIHPDIRNMCRQAAKLINRYPLKDPFSLQSSDDDDEQEGFTHDEQEDYTLESQDIKERDNSATLLDE
jgi:hypothetical protein